MRTWSGRPPASASTTLPPAQTAGQKIWSTCSATPTAGSGHWREQGHHQLPDFKLNDLHRRYDRLVDRALTLHPPRTGKQTPARNLALRLRDRKHEFLRFAADFTAGFSNNTAEQAIRMIKTKTKVSGGFRTLTGAQTFLTLRGYISTIRKNGLRALHALRDALTGNPWMPASQR